MKGKRHTTEDKNRILRAADGGKNIVEICKEENITESDEEVAFDVPDSVLHAPFFIRYGSDTPKLASAWSDAWG